MPDIPVAPFSQDLLSFSLPEHALEGKKRGGGGWPSKEKGILEDCFWWWWWWLHGRDGGCCVSSSSAPISSGGGLGFGRAHLVFPPFPPSSSIVCPSPKEATSEKEREREVLQTENEGKVSIQIGKRKILRSARARQ